MNNLNAPQIRIQNYDVYINPGSRPNLMQLAGITAIDFQGQDITNAVRIDDRQVNYQQPGQYRVIISVQDSAGNVAQSTININVATQNMSRTQPNMGAYQAASAPKSKSNLKKWLLGILGVVVIAMLWGFWHQNRVQNQQLQDAQSSVSSMSSESSSNSSSNASKIEDLSDANDALKEEISDLKDAIKEYKDDNDREDFQEEINELINENNNLANKIDQMNQNSATKALGSTVDKMSTALSSMQQAQSPEDAQKVLDDSDISGKLDFIKNAIDGIKDKLGI